MLTPFLPAQLVKLPRTCNQFDTISVNTHTYTCLHTCMQSTSFLRLNRCMAAVEHILIIYTISKNSNTHIHTRMSARTHIRTYTRVYQQELIYAHTRAYVSKNSRTHIRTYTRVCQQELTYTRACHPRFPQAAQLFKCGGPRPV
jgi:hypothetical protein